MAGRVHTSVSMAVSVREQMDTWCAVHGVSVTAVVEEALRAWVDRPGPVEVTAGDRVRVGVRVPRALLGAARSAARAQTVGMTAVVDAMVAARVRPRGSVVDPRVMPPGAS